MGKGTQSDTDSLGSLRARYRLSAGESDLLGRFCQSMEYDESLAKATRDAYLRLTVGFFRTVYPAAAITDCCLTVKPRAVRAYLADLAQAGKAASTLSLNRAALKAFYDFLRKSGIADLNPLIGVPTVRIPPRKPEALRESEIQLLLSTELLDEGWIAQRNHAILLTLYVTGIRRAELADLTWGCIDFSAFTMQVFGKGSKHRVVPITHELADTLIALRDYNCTAFPDIVVTSNSRVFLWKDGSPLNGSRVSLIVRRETGRVTDKQYRGPHALRHSCATHMLERGANIMFIKDLLGHVNLGTTQAYTHASLGRIRQEYLKCHPHAVDPPTTPATSPADSPAATSKPS